MKKSSKAESKTLLTLTTEEIASIHTIGNDLGDIWVNYAAVDGEGKVIAEGRVRTRSAEIQRLYATLPKVRMVLETGTHSPWVSRLLRSLGHEVIVANSRELHMIFKSKKKRDKVDARTLAKVGRFDVELLHPVHHRSEEIQRDTSMLRMREAAVGARTKLINCIRGSVKSTGERLPQCSADAFARKMRPHLPSVFAAALEPMVKAVEALTSQIHEYDKKVLELVKTKYPAAQRLMAINGVGPLTGLAFVLLIENPARFSSSRKVGAYFGLTPGLDESGASKPQMRITKQGDVLMRRLLVNAAHYILGKFGADSDLRRHGLTIAARGGKNAKKRAVIAVARKLAVIMHRLLLRNEAYDPLYNVKQRSLEMSAAA